MKSEPFRFSPTSAGVRTEHLNLQKNSNNTGCCNNNISSTQDTFSLPRARGHIKEEGLQEVVVEKSVKSGRHSRCGRSNKMRNCIIIAGVTIIVSLLSVVLLVECRSIKSSSKKGHNDDNDREFGHESRIQDATVEPDSDSSSEEYTVKSVSSSISSDKGASSKSTKQSSTSSPYGGRLTRSRVSVICKGGYGSEDDGDNIQDISTSSYPFTSVKSSKSAKTFHKQDKALSLPTLLPRASDDDIDEEGENDSGEEAYSSEETQQVVTVTGYSQVTGGKPETKSLKRSSALIKYTPKPPPAETTASPITEKDDKEESSSSEEVIITVKPKTKSSGHKSKSKAVPVVHNESVLEASSISSPNTGHVASKKSSKSSGSKRHQSKRNHGSSEEEEQNEDVHISSKRSKSSRSRTTQAPKHIEKQEKGDSGEIQEDNVAPTVRRLRAEKKAKKASEKRPKSAPVVSEPADPELESAEAEPAPVVVSKSRKSSKARSSSSKSSDQAKEASSVKPVQVQDDEDSSEEYNMEEMPFTSPHESSKSKKSQSSSSSNSSKNSSRNARMSSRTTAPKLRTRTFSSLESGD